jgi:methionyl-tRNA formyltransferase
MRIVFAGTPEFAVPPLEALVGGLHSVVAVYTSPTGRPGWV